MPLRLAVLALTAVLLAGCGGGSDAGSAAGASAAGGATVSDPATALPGAWTCDGGIVITLQTNGRYDWRVPADSAQRIGFGTDSSDQHQVHPDGGFSLLGPWRYSGGALELDMMGSTDRYQVTFASSDSLSLAGPDRYSCKRT